MNEIGYLAEDKATEYLRKEGYKILYRNERFYGVEVDIVAVKDKVLSFVEVKYRGSLELAMNSLKQQQIDRIKRAVNHFQEYKEFSIKLIAVSGNDLVMIEVI